MIISQLSTTAGGAGAALQRQEITAAVGDPPLRIFRRTLWMRLATSGLAERLEVLPGAVLRGTFGLLEYNAATTSNLALRATLGSLAGGVVVSMDAPRQVVRVVLPLGRGPGGSRLEFYRLDGDTPSSEPTLSVAREEIRIHQDPSKNVVGNLRSSRAGGGSGSQFVQSQDDKIAITSSSRYNGDFTDARFLLRLRSEEGATLPLTPADIQTLLIRSYPTNPRIGLSVPAGPGTPADPAAPLIVWRTDGEIGNGVPATAGAVDGGAALQADLQRMLGRFSDAVSDAAPAGAPAALPDTIDVALVIESDAPCVLSPPSTGSALRIEVMRVRESFPDGSAKQVLRFQEGGAGEVSLPLALPGGVQLSSVELRLDLSLGGDRSTGAAVTPALAAAGRQGIRADAGRRVAQRLQLAEATSVTALAIPLLPLGPRIEAILELRADSNDSPTGAVIASGRLEPGRTGRFGWVVLPLVPAIVVSTAAHWLVLSVASGAAVWLAAPNGGGLRMLDPAGLQLPATDAEELGALYDLRTRAGAAADAPPPLFLHLGGIAVPPPAAGEGQVTADLTEAARAAVGPAAPGTLLSLPVRVASSNRGVVTAYPPRLVFE